MDGSAYKIHFNFLTFEVPVYVLAVQVSWDVCAFLSSVIYKPVVGYFSPQFG